MLRFGLFQQPLQLEQRENEIIRFLGTQNRPPQLHVVTFAPDVCRRSHGRADAVKLLNDTLIRFGKHLKLSKLTISVDRTNILFG